MYSCESPKASQEWGCKLWFREEQSTMVCCHVAHAGLSQKTAANLGHLARNPVEGRSNKFGCLHHFSSKRINTCSLLISLQLNPFGISDDIVSLLTPRAQSIFLKYSPGLNQRCPQAESSLPTLSGRLIYLSFSGLHSCLYLGRTLRSASN